MSIGIPEIILILVVVLLLFGGKRIPELAKACGRATYEYKKAKEMLKKEADEIKKEIEANETPSQENQQQESAKTTEA